MPSNEWQELEEELAKGPTVLQRRKSRLDPGWGRHGLEFWVSQRMKPRSFTTAKSSSEMRYQHADNRSRTIIIIPQSPPDWRVARAVREASLHSSPETQPSKRFGCTILRNRRGIGHEFAALLEFAAVESEMRDRVWISEWWMREEDEILVNVTTVRIFRESHCYISHCGGLWFHSTRHYSPLFILPPRPLSTLSGIYPLIILRLPLHFDFQSGRIKIGSEW